MTLTYAQTAVADTLAYLKDNVEHLNDEEVAAIAAMKNRLAAAIVADEKADQAKAVEAFRESRASKDEQAAAEEEATTDEEAPPAA